MNISLIDNLIFHNLIPAGLAMRDCWYLEEPISKTRISCEVLAYCIMAAFYRNQIRSGNRNKGMEFFLRYYMYRIAIMSSGFTQSKSAQIASLLPEQAYRI